MTEKMNSVIPFDPAKLSRALLATAREVKSGAAFLRMDKTGAWVYGANADEVDMDSRFMVNPAGFQHGHVAWGDSVKLGEYIGPLTDPLPETGPVPGGCERGWEFQLGMHLLGISGEMKDIELVYCASSVGGKRAISELAQLVGNKLAALPADGKVVPVVELGSDSYKHQKYGKIYTPIIKLVQWTAMPKAPAASDPKALKKAKK